MRSTYSVMARIPILSLHMTQLRAAPKPGAKDVVIHALIQTHAETTMKPSYSVHSIMGATHRRQGVIAFEVMPFGSYPVSRALWVIHRKSCHIGHALTLRAASRWARLRSVSFRYRLRGSGS